MGISRTHRKQHRFTQIDNSGAEDPKLSLKSKGLLWYLMTKPNGWEVRNEHLMDKFNIGRDQLRSIFSEMENAGYLVRIKTQDPETGKFEWVTEVFETPEDCEIWKYHNQDLVDRALSGSTDHKAPKKKRVRKSSKTRGGLSTSGRPTPIVITESAMTDSLYSGASILNETTREEEENEASPVCTTGRSASCAVKGGEGNGHTLVAPLSNKTKEVVFTPAQVEPVTTTINASLSEETVKRREVRRLKSVLKLLELPRNIQGYVKQCTIDQLTYVIETAIDKSDSFEGEALVRYTVGIFKNTLDPNPEARKPKHKRLTSKQLGRMSSAHYKHKDKYHDDPNRDESKIYPPIRIKVDGQIIECVLCGYQHDPEWGIETLSYHTYREQEGRVTRGYEYHSVEVPNVEIFRSVYPNGFVKGDW